MRVSSGHLERRGALKLETLTHRELSTLERYKRRGFTFETGELRESLDMWDYMFFGEQRVPAMEF